MDSVGTTETSLTTCLVIAVVVLFFVFCFFCRGVVFSGGFCAFNEWAAVVACCRVSVVGT